MKASKGFTLIELLIVIAIIGILSTLTIIALGNTRAKARDAKRVADIQQISKALELYYADYGIYPTIITPGNSLLSPDGTKTYMSSIPNNPSPMNDNGCGNNNYTYASNSNNSDYSINFCLSGSTGTLSSGINSASSSGLGTAAGLVGWWKFDEGSGSSVIDYSGSGNNATWSGAGTHYITGKTGAYAGQFNGINDYASITENTKLRITTGSWGMWVYAHQWNAPPSVSRSYWIDGGGLLYMIFTDGSGIGYVQVLLASTQRYSLTFTPPSVNNWHHLMATYDGNSIKMYIDAVLVNSAQLPGSLNNASGIARIGDYTSDGSGAYLADGLIDDVRIYNRALSDAEVKAIYDATK